MKHAQIAIVVLFAAAIGCNGGEEETANAPVIPKVAFEGTLDKQVVGNWAQQGGSQNCDISEDGKAHMTGTVNTPGGPQKIDEQMEWKVNGKKLIFKSIGKDLIQQYNFEVAGDTMTLSTSKMKMVYNRKK